MGPKRKRNEENYEGMDIFKKYLQKMDQSYQPKQEMIDLMLKLWFN